MIEAARRNITEKIGLSIVDDKVRRILMFCTLNGALAIIAFVMSFINIFTGEYTLMMATLAFTVACALNVPMGMSNRLHDEIKYFIFGVEAMAVLAFFFISGIPDGFSALWICLVPSFSLLVFGERDGSIFSFAALVMIIFLFWAPQGKELLMYQYSETFMLRFPFLYGSMYFISLLAELVRKGTQKQLYQSREEFYYLYRHDYLTGLYNRFGINEYMDAALCENHKNRVAIILMDVDWFKRLNDNYGHEFGDRVLKEIAEVPLRIMCEHTHCCRWGGEEFLMIMQCEHDPAEIAEKLRSEIENLSFDYNGQKVHTTVSVGVCIAENLSNLSVHDMVEIADQAMYQAKHEGKNRVVVKHAN